MGFTLSSAREGVPLVPTQVCWHTVLTSQPPDLIPEERTAATTAQGLPGSSGNMGPMATEPLFSDGTFISINTHTTANAILIIGTWRCPAKG